MLDLLNGFDSWIFSYGMKAAEQLLIRNGSLQVFLVGRQESGQEPPFVGGIRASQLSQQFFCRGFDCVIQRLTYLLPKLFGQSK